MRVGRMRQATLRMLLLSIYRGGGGSWEGGMRGRAEAAVHNDKFQQSRIRVEGASASLHLLHAGLPCCATATLPQCKLRSRPQSSHWCLRSSWFGLTCPLLRNDWRRGAGSACSFGVPQLQCCQNGASHTCDTMSCLRELGRVSPDPLARTRKVAVELNRASLREYWQM